MSEDNEVNSRSRLKRIAALKGEPAPTFLPSSEGTTLKESIKDSLRGDPSKPLQGAITQTGWASEGAIKSELESGLVSDSADEATGLTQRCEIRPATGPTKNIPSTVTDQTIGQRRGRSIIGCTDPDCEKYRQQLSTMLDDAQRAYFEIRDQASVPLKAEITRRLPKPHITRDVKVRADIDEPIAEFVEYLATIPGVYSYASCQGTLGEGGPEPYRAYVSAHWTDEAGERLRREFEVVEEGKNFGTIYPNDWKPTSRATGATVGQFLLDYATTLPPAIARYLIQTTGPIALKFAEAYAEFINPSVPLKSETTSQFYIDESPNGGRYFIDKNLVSQEEFMQRRVNCPHEFSQGICKHCALKSETTLDELLATAKNHVMTPGEIEAQRQSWARGEMALTEAERGETAMFRPLKSETVPTEVAKPSPEAVKMRKFVNEHMMATGRNSPFLEANLPEPMDVFDMTVRLHTAQLVKFRNNYLLMIHFAALKCGVGTDELCPLHLLAPFMRVEPKDDDEF